MIFSDDKTERFIMNDALRREYINQTMNFVPGLQEKYEKLLSENFFNNYQEKLVLGDTSIINIGKSIEYIGELMQFSRFLFK